MMVPFSLCIRIRLHVSLYESRILSAGFAWGSLSAFLSESVFSFWGKRVYKKVKRKKDRKKMPKIKLILPVLQVRTTGSASDSRAIS